jgi:hypothetical protein
VGEQEPVLYIEPGDRHGIPANVLSTVMLLIGKAYPNAIMAPGRVGGRGFGLVIPEPATAKRVTKKAIAESMVEPDEFEPGIIGWTDEGSLRMETPPELAERLAVVAYLFLSKFPEAENYVEQEVTYTDEETGQPRRLAFSVAWSPQQTPREKHKQAVQERDLLAQAMWDARGILGFDNDGDPTPAASVNGWNGYKEFADQHVREATEARKDHDDALGEQPTFEQVYNAWHGRPLDAGWGGCADKEAVQRVMDLIRGLPVTVPGCARCTYDDHGKGREAHVDGAGLVIR